jgi:ABC-2 type transport system permease protein
MRESASLVRTAGVVLRQYYLVRGSASRVIPLFAWVAVDIVLWGFITRYLNAISHARVDFVPVMLGAVLLWDFFSRVMHGVTMAFLEDVWSRNFLNFFATPMSVSEYLAGLVLSSIATSTVGLIVMLVLSTFVFGLSFAVYGAALLPFLVVLFLFGISLGILGCAIVLRFGPASEWFIWPLPGLISPFAGVFYPIDTLPAWMQYLARLLPPAYVFEGMRTILAGGHVPGGVLLGGATLALADVLVASWVFTRVYRHAVRTGLIARYSAETVS